MKGVGSRSVRCDEMQDARTWVRIEYQGKNGWIPLGDEEQGERYYGSSGSSGSSSGRNYFLKFKFANTNFSRLSRRLYLW